MNRYVKEKTGDRDEDEEDDEDDEEEEDEEELGRNLYKHIISGSNACFTDFVAKNHDNVENIKNTLSATIDPSKYGFSVGLEESQTKTVLEYMRSLEQTQGNKFSGGNDQPLYFSFCYGHIVDKQHGSHCEICGQCADWRSWHCWNCNRCTDSTSSPEVFSWANHLTGQTLPVCEHCGNSSMTGGPKFKTRPASWRVTSKCTSPLR